MTALTYGFRDLKEENTLKFLKKSAKLIKQVQQLCSKLTRKYLKQLFITVKLC